ncbi:phenol hydroxylase subunit [Pseudomonas sp. NPDC089554]|uniref:phenol hydroxylase subunit n=1 Tax=Pseudomonas sp. NPDC089554 TaxID=3390653 RepID=UPI003CFC3718
MSSHANTLEQMPRYIRIRSEPEAPYVEFDFAIGYPELYVELVLPAEAFQQFCRQQQVRHMDAQMCAAIDADARKWRFGDAG